MAYSKQITVGKEERVCINCTQYRRCWRDSTVRRKEYNTVVPVSFGYCLRHTRQCSPLRQPCKDYETESGKQ